MTDSSDRRSEGGAERPSFARYRDIMEARGFRPSKRLGQNFLLDPTLHRAIADAAELTRADVALEVGPGLGFLTRELVARAGRVVAVEVDPRLASIVREDLDRRDGAFGAPDAAPLDLVEADALDGPALGSALSRAVEAARSELLAPGRVAVVANLPYAVSGRFLGALLDGSSPDLRNALSTVVVVVQAELGDRLAARPGTREYGSLSVLAQASGTVERLRRIGREVFRPRPKVDSALVRVHHIRPIPAGFGAWVREVFHARRKTLRHAFERLEGRAGVSAARPPAWGAYAGRRAESCTVDELLALYTAGDWRVRAP